MLTLTDRFQEALHVAQDLYPADNGDAQDHTSHLLQVAGIVLEAGGDEDQAIAALFHDALEDAETEEEVGERLSLIRDEFGERAAEIVVDCTDRRTNGAGKSWKDRKEEYIHHLWTEADDAVVRVSAADKLSAARALLREYRMHGEAVWSRYEGGRSGTIWYYRALIGAYRYRKVNGHVDELEDIISRLEKATDLK